MNRRFVALIPWKSGSGGHDIELKYWTDEKTDDFYKFDFLLVLYFMSRFVFIVFQIFRPTLSLFKIRRLTFPICIKLFDRRIVRLWIFEKVSREVSVQSRYFLSVLLRVCTETWDMFLSNSGVEKCLDIWFSFIKLRTHEQMFVPYRKFGK